MGGPDEPLVFLAEVSGEKPGAVRKHPGARPDLDASKDIDGYLSRGSWTVSPASGATAAT